MSTKKSMIVDPHKKAKGEVNCNSLISGSANCSFAEPRTIRITAKTRLMIIHRMPPGRDLIVGCKTVTIWSQLGVSPCATMRVWGSIPPASSKCNQPCCNIIRLLFAADHFPDPPSSPVYPSITWNNLIHFPSQYCHTQNGSLPIVAVRRQNLLNRYFKIYRVGAVYDVSILPDSHFISQNERS